MTDDLSPTQRISARSAPPLRQSQPRFAWGCLASLVLAGAFIILAVWSSGAQLTLVGARLLADRARRTDLSHQILQVSELIWPASARLSAALGQSYLQLGDTTQAVASFRRALEKDESLAVAQNDLGVTLFTGGQFDQAIPYLQAAVGLDPGSPQVFLNLGRAYLAAGQPQAAQVSFQHAASLDPTLLEAWVQTGQIALARGDLSAALRAFDQALALNPANPASLQGKGILALQASQPVDALTALQAARSLQPGNAAIHYYLGLALARLGKVEGAKTELEQAIALSKEPTIIQRAEAQLEQLSPAPSPALEPQGGAPYP